MYQSNSTCWRDLGCSMVVGSFFLLALLITGINAFAGPATESGDQSEVYEIGGPPVESLSTRVARERLDYDRVTQINSVPASSAGEVQGSGGGDNNDALGDQRHDSGQESTQWELYNQVEMLQEEVQQLRGLIEGQRHQLESLMRKQKEHYIDLDHRIGQLNTSNRSASSTGNSPGITRPGNLPVADGGIGGAAITTPNKTIPSVPVDDEKSRYDNAIALVRAKKFMESEEVFRHFLQDYPNSAYTPNAHYWLGEVYLALPNVDFDKARMHFETVTTQFPEHSKASACMYKLGVLHHRQGDKDKAKTLFHRVIDTYPGSSAAGLARKDLNKISSP